VSRPTFLKCRDFLDGRDQLFFFLVKIFKIETFQLRLWGVEIFVEIVETRQDCWDLSRRSRDLSRPFESENDEKSRRIEKSQWENTKIHALLDRDQDKLSRHSKIFRSWQISWSRSRLFGLNIDVETKSRSLDLDQDFSTVETHFLTLSRFSRLSRPFDRDTIETNQDPQG